VLPDVVDVHAPPEGAAGLVFVALAKRYPGHAYQAAYGLWSLGLLALTKVVVVVDHWVPVHDVRTAWWAALANVDPARDVLVARGPGSVLDHALGAFSFGGKMVVDGTRKWPEELGPGARPWPEPVFMDRETVERVSRRWAEYGLGPDPGPTAPWWPGHLEPPTWSGAREAAEGDRDGAP